jgi:prepilin-type processing-associated H-X9-DG protein
MKSRQRQFRNAAFTMNELLVIMGVLALLAALLVPALAIAKQKSRKISCSCRLKQIGLAFRIFANDRGDAYPMNVSTNKGGSMEYLSSTEVFRHFQVISNELSTPKILVCPSDTRRAALDFPTLSNVNVSYFLSLDAADTNPSSLLAGDRNLVTNGVPVGSGLLKLMTNMNVGWTMSTHQGSGNVVLGDGSVQSFPSARLQEQSTNSGMKINRLAIP